MTIVLIGVILGAAILIAILNQRGRRVLSDSSETAAQKASARESYSAFLAGAITIDEFRDRLVATGLPQERIAKLTAEAPRLKAEVGKRAPRPPAELLTESQIADHLKAFVCGAISQEQFEKPFVELRMSRSQIDQHVQGALRLRAMMEGQSGEQR